ncbi:MULTISPECIES: hypothetical protein [unclassified Flavobacterium]|uniref:hypothetical protein n=1 Tax=unclassified Flavobacterium TaxID=196869 RepID=UPI00131ADB4B|nr:MULTISPECIES: hypothetical protein [unclassified Flavobacterium]
MEKFEKKKDKRKLDPTQIEKENIKISKQQIKINNLKEDVVKAEKKLSKVRD